MKDMPSSPALLGDASDHPEGVSKQASKEASGHPKILKIEEMEKKTAKLPKVIRISKEIAELTASLYADSIEIGEVIEVLQENGYKVVEEDFGVFKMYKVI
ncbi:MAG: hypothetical protein QW272_09750 [Candidatus Methanomethylicaceae archaeon]